MRVFWEVLQPVVRAAVDFVYPPACLVCEQRMDSNHRLVCSTCWAGLPRIGTADETPPEVRPWFELVAVWEYSEAVQEIIHHMKYFGKRALTGPMGEAMAQAIMAAGIRADVIVPVPLHKRRLRERGYNQSLLLSQAMGRVLGLPVAEMLQRIRYTRPQSALGPEERRKNVLGAFKWVGGEDLVGKVVLLVDDVFTTGSTLRVCAEELLGAKSKKIIAVTAAKALA